ncbi:MAG TPA: TonB-dependent siderophore receptor [Methylophaga aminisulfidivorans]|uniref:TonB-dependent receptor family protein n=1 Tax=Methylophaga TaxID=40222 RepID=UPI001770303C|nr:MULTISPECIES: TonB-dependent siderophore receptor [Methylophaga]HIC47184.1 TonB-dependent siderophore receptor [Methylophaga sp.]HIM40173.1 TonB-dependent siderophore receptor [Methylophaga aminisulfidivorans]
MQLSKKKLLVLMASAWLTPAIAADKPAELDALVVNSDWLGETTEQSVKTYPGSREVLTQEELHETGALNIEDALRRVNGVQVLDETGTGILPNIGIRGLNPLRSERLQMLVDGYPIGIGPYTNVGVSLFPVTLPSIEAVDIVRGGAAVHYGPNNVGGVLNLVTKPISRDFEQSIRERITVAEDTGNAYYDTYYRASGFVTDDLGLQLQVNLQDGEGFRESSDTDVQNIILDAQYFVNDKNELDIQLQYYNVDAELPGSLSPSAYRADRTDSQRPYDAYDADMLRGTLTWTYNPNNDVEFQWRNFAHKADRTFFFGQDLTSGGHWADPAGTASHVADSPRIFYVYGTEPRITVKHDNHTLMAGARFVKEQVSFDVNRLELATNNYSEVRNWNFDTEAYAFYVSDSISLLDDRLTVTPGVRYEDVRTDFEDRISNTKDENDTDKFLPGLTVGLQATDAVFLFANAQRSLVPVQTAQVTREGEVANELAWNYEIGSRVALNPNLSVSGTLFRIDYEDQVQFNRTISQYENLGETRHEGVELTADWQATPQLAVGLGYTYLDTEQLNGENKGNELANAPEHHLSAYVDYRVGPWKANLNALHVSESFSDAANTDMETTNGSAGELPAYTLLNTRLSREFNVGGNNLEIALAVNNLLDEEYYFRGVDVSPVGRLPAPGRSFILEGSLDF